jgi:alginate O-acetyltransferase complex protein AlgI
MLFNSYTFIFIFLPATLVVYHGLQKAGLVRASRLALTLASLFFYGWWNPIYLLLLVPLTLANYALARQMAPRQGHLAPHARLLLVVGLAMNVGALGYFKYANFFVDNANNLLGMDLFLARVVLPLGISFFTFQKIAFLVDAYRGKVDHFDLLDFALFVSFFPQLIAGPIVHHSEMLPQFRRPAPLTGDLAARGLTIFVIGLAKKVLLADTAALCATPVFAAAAAGTKPDFIAAWSGALAYTVQLYFDFSGYSDMAIGAALLFGIRLPVNFASPYKAASITDFWRCWHVTLSRFLRDYLYIPLGGNKKGAFRSYVNLLITMLLGGLWHGAGWTFVVWGGLHGAYLATNRAWRTLRSRWLSVAAGPSEVFLGRVLTFVAVVVGWVFFRAADCATALRMLWGMAGGNGLVIPPALAAWLLGGVHDAGFVVIAGLLLLAWLAPNTQELTGYEGTSDLRPPAAAVQWSPTLRWGLATGTLLAVSIMSLSHISEFLYFQF